MMAAPGKTPCDPSAGVIVSVAAGAAFAAEQLAAPSAATEIAMAKANGLRRQTDLNFPRRTRHASVPR